MTAADDVLAHHGVKGMKWGVRRADKSSSSGPVEVTLKEKPGAKVRASGGQGHAPSEDAKRAAVSKQKAKASSTDALSNKELQDLVTRMNLEQQYNRLNPKTGVFAQGQKVVKTILTAGATANQVIAFKNSPAGKALDEQLKSKKPAA